jgi:hypothetical protein
MHLNSLSQLLLATVWQLITSEGEWLYHQIVIVACIMLSLYLYKRTIIAALPYEDDRSTIEIPTL